MLLDNANNILRIVCSCIYHSYQNPLNRQITVQESLCLTNCHKKLFKAFKRQIWTETLAFILSGLICCGNAGLYNFSEYRLV